MSEILENQKEDNESDEKELKVPNENDYNHFTNSASSTDLFFENSMKLQYELPLPLEEPFDLRVGNFDNVLDQINGVNRNLTKNLMPMISVSQVECLLDPKGTKKSALEQAWFDSPGTPRSFLAEEMMTLLKTSIKPNLTVIVEGKYFRCHSMVLGLLSTLFHRQDWAHTHIFQLPSSIITARAFASMYRWVLEPCDHMSFDLLLEIFYASRFFGCQDIIDNLWNGVDEGSRTPEGALYLYIGSIKLGLHLEESLLSRLGSMFLLFVGSQEFLLLEMNTVKRFLDLPSLAVNSELEVFYSLIIWLNYKWPQRKEFAFNMISAIHFDLMPFLFLMAIVGEMKCGPPVIQMLLTSPEIRVQAFESMKKIKKYKYRYLGRFGDFSRNWIYDYRAPHHHGVNCKQIQYYELDSFLSYIKWLQTAGINHLLAVRAIDDPKIRCCPFHERP
ncbi:uncharacterized protein LOC108104927 [Drosophila eugracilis]|uniref:uncharacterized protein LOC108104927 n=1 Tax=Drosophila eugracilis TaxID=29029 RepID=UPI0007E5DDCC|nr:uncharacterized protein LOC108104927 [Drosophila eugracilis]